MVKRFVSQIGVRLPLVNFQHERAVVSGLSEIGQQRTPRHSCIQRKQMLVADSVIGMNMDKAKAFHNPGMAKQVRVAFQMRMAGIEEDGGSWVAFDLPEKPKQVIRG